MKRAKRGNPGVRVIRPLRDFLAAEAAGGLLLVATAVVALIWANSPWSGSYRALWASHIDLRAAGHSLDLDLRHWVNDGLMTLFFFVVGLEIKRELVEGELRDRRRAALPAIAALGGMVVPATIYLAVNVGGQGARGWGIPMATDIALALGALQLIAPRAHSSMKLFLLVLAIVDDIGAILVIALFYSGGVRGWMLLGAAVGVGAIVCTRLIGAQSISLFAFLGVVLWWFTHESGIHATLAGVVLGLLTPARPKLTLDLIDEDDVAVLNDLSSVEAVRDTVELARRTVSVVEWIEHHLHPWTTKVIVPLFVLANVGVALSASSLRNAVDSRVTLGIVVGLVLGKLIGITGATWLAVRSGVSELPDGLTWRSVIGVAGLGGIGFTVSLFVAGLSFNDPQSQDAAKVGVLAATVIATLIATVALRAGTQVPARSASTG
jgi:Na+:H+ antiporter, NhaA family